VKHEEPSVTAAAVAATLLLLRDDPDFDAVVDEQTRQLVAAAVRQVVPGFGALYDRIPYPLLRRMAGGVERALSPGFIAHYAIRKRGVRAELDRAITDDGYTQVVLLGAGFDMISASLPKHVRVFEIDHPTTQAAKARARDVMSASPNVVLVPADFTKTTIADALAIAPTYEAKRPTVFVAEGLLMYLERDVVLRMLDDVVVASKHARLIATLIPPDRSGVVRLHSQRRAVDWMMKALNERFVWGEPITNVTALLEARGMRVLRQSTTTELAGTERARRRLPRPTGEVLLVSESIRSEGRRPGGDVMRRTPDTPYSAYRS